jgi:hypothetical protein
MVILYNGSIIQDVYLSQDQTGYINGVNFYPIDQCLVIEDHSKNRYNSGKPKWSLVDFESLLPMVRVLEFGSLKYSPNQWKNGLNIDEICESMCRHLFSYMQGEQNDPESKLSHIGHIQCNAMFLNYMIRNMKTENIKNE